MATAKLGTESQKIPGNIIAVERKKTEVSIRQQKQKENLLKDLESFLSKNDQLPDNLKNIARIFINAAKLTLNRKSFLKTLEFQKECFSRSVLTAEDMPIINNGADKEGLQFEADLRKDTMNHLKQFDDEISRVNDLITKAEKYENAVFSKLYKTGDAIFTEEGSDCTASELLSNERLVATRKLLQLLGQVKQLYGMAE